MTTATATLTLWLLMDPLGNLPIFSTVMRGVDPQRRRHVLRRELLIALAFLVAFLFLGKYLFALLQLEEESVRVAGGLILLTIAFRMLFSDADAVWGSAEGEPLLFPLAVPMMAGPATLSLLLLLSSSEPGRTLDWLLAVCIAWGGSALILSASNRIGRLVGDRGLGVVQRLMGMLLICIAVQMSLQGISALMAS